MCVAALIVREMNKKTKYVLLCFGLLNFTIAGVTDAAAYLDPGTGSIIFQGIIAVVASGVAIFVTAWKSVLQFFNGFFNGNTKKQSDKE